MPDRTAGSPRTLLSTSRSASGFSTPMKLRPPASCPDGSTAHKTRWRCSFCSTSSRAICFAATRAPSRPIRWRARLPRARSCAASTARSPKELRGFFYLPFEHSEDLADQERGIAFYKATGDADDLKWAEIHADIIRRFGRFPHRNAVLGRTTTPEEQKFLDERWLQRSDAKSAGRCPPPLLDLHPTMSRPSRPVASKGGDPCCILPMRFGAF